MYLVLQYDGVKLTLSQFLYSSSDISANIGIAKPPYFAGRESSFISIWFTFIPSVIAGVKFVRMMSSIGFNGWLISEIVFIIYFSLCLKPLTKQLYAAWGSSFAISQRLFHSFAIWSVLLIIYLSLYSWLPITAPRCRLPLTVMLVFVFSNNFSASFTSWGFTINQHLLASGLQPNFGPKLHKAFHHSWYYLVIHQLINCLQAQPFSFVCSEIFLLVPITSLLAVLSRLRTLSLLSDHLDFVPSCDVISALPITKSRDSKL